MKAFTTLTGIAAPLALINVDTDMIIPKQYLKTIKRTGLGKHLFDEMRFTPEGKEIPDFVLNREPYRHASILVSGDNFGCGSSREHAPWALNDFGIRCVIAPSFADIFYNNCFQNGMLPLKLPKDQVDQLMEDAKAGREITVDLQNQIVKAGNKQFSFQIDSFRRDCLLKGLDAIGLTLQHEGEITSFEKTRVKETPWL
jgi:3-isopropylmalate/(R)-2-methylmalate dehydratase small subunit